MLFRSELTLSGDPYAANVSLLLRGNTAPAVTVKDDSNSDFAITKYRNARIANNVYKYGTSSLYFGGGDFVSTDLYSAADYLDIPNGYDIITTGSFTVEAWIYKQNADLGVVVGNFGWDSGNNGGWYLSVTNDNKLLVQGSNGTWNNQATIIVSSATISLNTWTHIAFTRDSSNTVRLFIDGTLCGTLENYSNSLTLEGGSGPSIKSLKVGTYRADSYYVCPFVGYIDDLRITSGVARYTANFTPPASELPNS